jgi:hypothetical protein
VEGAGCQTFIGMTPASKVVRRLLPVVLVAALTVPVATAAPSRVARAASARAIRFQSTVFQGAGGEPNVSVSPDGSTVLVDGLGADPATLYRSTDGGRSFALIQPAFSRTGGGDWDMHWIDDHTVVAADLSLTDGIFVHRSEDGGLTWTTAQIHTDVYDRPWLAVDGQNVYVVAKGFDAIPYCFVSTDGGKTFAPTPIPLYGTGTLPAEAGGTSPNAAEATVENQDGYIDHAVTNPKNGDLYVLYGLSSFATYSQKKPLGVPSRLYVAHLEDGPAGPQFASYPVYLGDGSDGFIDGFNWLTIDAKGTLYVLANGMHEGHESTWLTYSKDGGKHWSKLVDVGEAGNTNVYGSIAAGTPGTLAMVYLRGTKGDPAEKQPWYAGFARITRANTGHPSVVHSRPVPKPIHTQDICFDGIVCGLPGFGQNRDLLDYIWNVITPDGRALGVYASDGPATGGGGVSVIFIRQTSGPSFGPGAPS